MLPKIITFQDQSVFNFSASDVFTIVIDIEKYPDFIPWCDKIEIISRDNLGIIADSVIKFKSIIANYRSEISFFSPSENKNGYIKVVSNKGAFKYLNNVWEFIDRGKNKTLVKFSIECEFRSKIMHYMMSIIYKRAQQKVIAAFKNRIESLLKQR
ncbi:MAG: type II toxin-antitoxin system RatA family toxin [Rickettsiaceae bacterium H1]|nr:type II toxin-antitoxin system RatA family toxin [Rickettsiaceae bacterium H1]